MSLDGVDNANPRWRNAPTVATRGKWHGYRMRLDLSDDVDRQTYFLGRNYDREIQLLLDQLLRPGDTFLDVGANIGNTSLHAAARVGPKGRVIAVEPQNDCCQRLRATLAENGIHHVELHQVGLADRAGKQTLKVLGRGTLMSTFAADANFDGPNLRQTLQVEVSTGDALLRDRVLGNLVIKIDVEGYELHALRGLEQTIIHYRPPIITEVEPELLRRSGFSEQDLFGFLQERGYAAQVIGMKRNWLRQWLLHLRPISQPEQLDEGDNDVIWLHGNERA